MIFAEAKCDDCNHVFEIIKENTLDDFIIGKCPECNSDKVHRKFGLGGIDIAQGGLGNSKNNQENTFTYHPSSMVGRQKGTTVKTIK